MEFLKLNKIFVDYYSVPDYQRDYEWTNAQNSVLVDDIFSLLNDDQEKHFLGAIVTIPFEENNATNKSIDIDSYSISKSNIKHIVDGQQRLTSVSIFCKAILDIIKEDKTISDNAKDKQCDKLKPLIYGNDYNRDDNRAPRIILNGNTGNYYNRYILNQSKENCNKTYKGAKRIAAAFSLFKKEIQERLIKSINNNECSDNLDFYRRIIGVITDQIELVEIECSASSNAFQVFDSLNGKGLDLTAADRIKNIMLSWSPQGKGAAKWDALSNSVGEDYLTNFFVSLFFRLQGKRVSKNKLPEEFRKTFKQDAESSFDGFFNTMFERGILFGRLKNGKTNNAVLNEALSDLAQLKSEQVYAILFSMADIYSEHDIINKKEYLDFVKAVTSLIVRIQVCEKSTNRLDSIFSKCVSKAKDEHKTLKEITKLVKDDSRTLVPDDEFQTAFINFAPEDSSVSEYYLRSLENYLRVSISNNRVKVQKGLTVEHIIPQNIDLNKWYENKLVPPNVTDDPKSSLKERLGNKLLLFGDDNSSAGNCLYKDKIHVYKNGKRGQIDGKPYTTFELVKDLVDKYKTEFLDNEVNERQKYMASLAIKIW